MKTETLFTLGIVAVILYILYELAQTFGINSNSISSAAQSIGDTVSNATGNLSTSQESGLVSAETQSLIQAGMNPSTASAVSQQDVTNATSGPGAPTYWDGVKAAFEEIF